nr:uncharacterized protein LOC121468200 [Taeniopygia guttata]
MELAFAVAALSESVDSNMLPSSLVHTGLDLQMGLTSPWSRKWRTNVRHCTGSSERAAATAGSSPVGSFSGHCDLCRRERQSGERCEKTATQAVSSAGRSSRPTGGVGTRPSTQPGRTATAGTEAPISVRRCVRGCGRDLPNTRKTVCGVRNRYCSVFSEERRWQSVAEPFMDFVDRVRASVEKRVQNPELQDQLTLEIATTNANEACQRVILALPASPPPTLNQLIEECTRKATLMTEDSVISPRKGWLLQQQQP